MHGKLHTTLLLSAVIIILGGLYTYNKLAIILPETEMSKTPQAIDTHSVISTIPLEINRANSKEVQTTKVIESKVNPADPILIYPELLRGNTSKKQVIFTFDAGSGAQSVVQILQTLDKHVVKGDFFVTGKWMSDNPDLTKKIIQEGHSIFNHSFTHPYFTKLSDKDIASELNATDAIFYSLTGLSTKPYFRPPYGDRDARVLKIAAEQGYRSIYWTLDTLDWKEGMTTQKVKDRILSNLQPGMIILMHVGSTITGDILDDVFTEIQNRGYVISSLEQGM